MPRPTIREPERGGARARLLDAACELFRVKGYAATSIDDLCKSAAVTKGSFFHHFPNKEALGVAVANQWTSTTTEFFADAPYHDADDAMQRLLGYVAFRKSIITGNLASFTCLAGTLVQEVYDQWPAIREACAESIFRHAATLENDIAEVMTARKISGNWTPASLARHTQTVLQGAFVLAKAGNDAELALESLDHLERYLQLVLAVPTSSYS